jgi:LysM repeat protein
MMYFVQKGDTLSEIAQRNHLTVDQIMAVNPQIKDKNKIYAGDTIYLPLFVGWWSEFWTGLRKIFYK